MNNKMIILKELSPHTRLGMGSLGTQIQGWDSKPTLLSCHGRMIPACSSQTSCGPSQEMPNPSPAPDLHQN